MASTRVPKAPAPAAEGLSFLHEQFGAANQPAAQAGAPSTTRLDAPTKPANDEAAAGLSALFQQLARPAGAAPAAGGAGLGTVVGVNVGADGRSLLLEQLGRAGANGPEAEAQRARLAASVMATFAGNAQGRSALFDQLARGAPPSAANDDESNRALQMLDTLAAMPEGRAALLAQFSRMVPGAKQQAEKGAPGTAVARSRMALPADGRSAVVQLVAGNAPRKTGVERVQIVPGAGVGRTALVAGLDRPRASEDKARRIPLWAAIAAVAIAVGGLAGWKLWPRSPQHAGSSSVLVADFDNRTGDAVFDGTVEPGFALALANTPALKPMSRAAALQSAEQLGLPGARLPEDRARAVARHNGVQVVTSGIIQRAGDGYRVTVRAIDVVSGNRVAEESVTVPGKGAVLDEATRLADQMRQAITAWAADATARASTH